MFSKYYQIQAYPTAIIYVKSGKRQLIDVPLSQYNLVNLILFLPISPATQQDSGKATFGLVSVSVQNSIIQNQSDNAAANIALASILQLLPVTQSQSDTPKATIGLVSMLQLLPINATTINEATAAGFKLVSNS